MDVFEPAPPPGPRRDSEAEIACGLPAGTESFVRPARAGGAAEAVGREVVTGVRLAGGGGDPLEPPAGPADVGPLERVGDVDVAEVPERFTVVVVLVRSAGDDDVVTFVVVVDGGCVETVVVVEGAVVPTVTGAVGTGTAFVVVVTVGEGVVAASTVTGPTVALTDVGDVMASATRDDVALIVSVAVDSSSADACGAEISDSATDANSHARADRERTPTMRLVDTRLDDIPD